ncbi:MAG: right-handed parallel beta-helix repeat-containing protein, partial [Thermogutta sp.]|nr:right-handed parallel beta-helix repeat-containing protein [Thermogutta sp.]
MSKRKILALLMAVLLGWAARPYALAQDFFVATDGNDAWSGKSAGPNADRTDGPFATLARAQQAARELKKRQPDAAVTVAVRGGFYPLS